MSRGVARDCLISQIGGFPPILLRSRNEARCSTKIQIAQLYLDPSHKDRQPSLSSRPANLELAKRPHLLLPSDPRRCSRAYVLAICTLFLCIGRKLHTQKHRSTGQSTRVVICAGLTIWLRPTCLRPKLTERLEEFSLKSTVTPPKSRPVHPFGRPSHARLNFMSLKSLTSCTHASCPAALHPVPDTGQRTVLCFFETCSIGDRVEAPSPRLSPRRQDVATTPDRVGQGGRSGSVYTPSCELLM